MGVVVVGESDIARVFGKAVSTRPFAPSADDGIVVEAIGRETFLVHIRGCIAARLRRARELMSASRGSELIFTRGDDAVGTAEVAHRPVGWATDKKQSLRRKCCDVVERNGPKKGCIHRDLRKSSRAL